MAEATGSQLSNGAHRHILLHTSYLSCTISKTDFGKQTSTAEATGSPLYQSQLRVVLVCHTKHNFGVIVTKAAKEEAFRHCCESELLNKEVCSSARRAPSLFATKSSSYPQQSAGYACHIKKRVSFLVLKGRLW